MSPAVMFAVLAVAIVIVAMLAFASRRPAPAPASAAPADPPPDPSNGPVPEARNSMPLGIPPAPPIDDLGDDDAEDSNSLERMLVTAVGMTDPGLQREHNEDAYVCLDEHGVYAIADGMGKRAAGEVASKLTVEAISDAFQNNLLMDPDEPDCTRAQRRRLVRVIERANEVVLAMADEVEAYRGMGTTVVVANFSACKHRLHIAHVGDSRCYRIRCGRILQLTVDHTLGNIGVMGNMGSLLSRAVGIEKHVDVDIITDKAEIGDVYLLCSDGLSRMMTDDKILQTVLENADLDDANRKLIAVAMEAGGCDNVTAILVRVDGWESYVRQLCSSKLRP